LAEAPQSGSVAALVLERVDALYGDSHVLHEVSLTLRPGRLLALLGRNGAGKTTCMSSIIGFLRPRSGDIRLHGVSIARRTPEAIARLGVGLVPQGRRVFASLSVEENLAVAARAPHGLTSPGMAGATVWSAERAYDAFPRLGERRRQLAGSLSGGEQQMLAIARALVSNPRVLLLDEPSEGLAPIVVHEVGETLLALKAAGHSILLVEQNTTLALKVADEVAILNTGRIVYDGTAGDLQGKPDILQQNLGVI
jgi:branched-chain amino acid transport system ATP-binding protein